MQGVDERTIAAYIGRGQPRSSVNKRVWHYMIGGLILHRDAWLSDADRQILIDWGERRAGGGEGAEEAASPAEEPDG